MTRYALYDHKDGSLVGTYSAGAITPLIKIDEVEIEWSVEQFGRCDTDEYVVVEAGHPYPGEYPETQTETADVPLDGMG